VTCGSKGLFGPLWSRVVLGGLTSYFWLLVSVIVGILGVAQGPAEGVCDGCRAIFLVIAGHLRAFAHLGGFHGVAHGGGLV